jgi:hypothetical protein
MYTLLLLACHFTNLKQMLTFPNVPLSKSGISNEYSIAFLFVFF